MISWKWCKIEMLLLQATDSESYTIYLTVMTFIVLDCRFLIASLFLCDFSSYIHLALPFVLP